MNQIIFDQVNDNKKYNGMGYMACNGYVPCQVLKWLSNHLSSYSYTSPQDWIKAKKTNDSMFEMQTVINNEK